MGFSEDTIPEGSIDPREQARLDAEAWKEANREKDLIEFNLSGRDNQNVAINLPDGQTIRINDPIEKAAALAGTVLTGSAASVLKKAGSGAKKVFSSGLEPDDPRFGPGKPSAVQKPAAKKSGGCLGFGCIIPAVIAVLVTGVIIMLAIS